MDSEEAYFSVCLSVCPRREVLVDLGISVSRKEYTTGGAMCVFSRFSRFVRDNFMLCT